MRKEVFNETKEIDGFTVQDGFVGVFDKSSDGKEELVAVSNGRVIGNMMEIYGQIDDGTDSKEWEAKWYAAEDPVGELFSEEFALAYELERLEKERDRLSFLQDYDGEDYFDEWQDLAEYEKEAEKIHISDVDLFNKENGDAHFREVQEAQLTDNLENGFLYDVITTSRDSGIMTRGGKALKQTRIIETEKEEEEPYEYVTTVRKGIERYNAGLDVCEYARTTSPKEAVKLHQAILKEWRGVEKLRAKLAKELQSNGALKPFSKAKIVVREQKLVLNNKCEQKEEHLKYCLLEEDQTTLYRHINNILRDPKKQREVIKNDIDIITFDNKKDFDEAKSVIQRYALGGKIERVNDKEQSENKEKMQNKIVKIKINMPRHTSRDKGKGL